MEIVQTVNGPIHISDLGVTTPHEHIFLNIQNQYPGKKEIYGVDGDNDKVNIQNLGILRREGYLIRDNLIIDDLDTAIYELGYFKRAGGQTVIDLTLEDVGRDVRKLKAVSDALDINIVVGCGLYTADTVSSRFFDMDVHELSELMIRELTVGIDDTGIKAGVIGEIGTSKEIYPIEEKALRAAALASKATGLPIYVHTYPWGKMALKALDIIEEYGCSPTNVCMCHVGGDLDYVTEVLKRGAYIGFDGFSKEFYIIAKPGEFAGAFETDVERVHRLSELAEMGYEKQILSSTDICFKTLLRSYGGWGYDHIYTNIIPMMKNEGLDEALINTLIYENPIRFLSG